MKKLYFVALLTVLLVGTHAFADVVTTTRRINPTSTPSQQKRVTNPAVKKVNTQQQAPSSNETRLSQSVKTCRKYSETLDSTISGVDFNFKISILGWNNNKCRVDFVAKSTGINEIFSSLHGMDASMATITTFEPNVRCEFTKQQLERVGDSILQEEERAKNSGRKMLTDPSLVTIKSVSELSGSDAALMDVILRERACTILNAPDSDAMFDSLLNY